MARQCTFPYLRKTSYKDDKRNSDPITFAWEKKMLDAMDKEAKILLKAGQAAIPASPHHLSLLWARMGAPNLDINELAGLILKDFGLALFFLKWANSAFFASGVHASPLSMSKIIMMLGLDNMSAALSDVPQLSKEQLAGMDPYCRRQLFCVARATFCGRIAARISDAVDAEKEEASLLAMISSLGECLTAFAFPRVAILLESMKDEKERRKMARRLLFYTPGGLALQIAKRWNLPEPVIKLLSSQGSFDLRQADQEAIASCLAYGLNQFLKAAESRVRTGKKQKESLSFLEEQLHISVHGLISFISSGLSDLKDDNPAFYQVLYEQGLIKRLPI